MVCLVTGFPSKVAALQFEYVHAAMAGVHLLIQASSDGPGSTPTLPDTFPKNCVRSKSSRVPLRPASKSLLCNRTNHVSSPSWKACISCSGPRASRAGRSLSIFSKRACSERGKSMARTDQICQTGSRSRWTVMPNRAPSRTAYKILIPRTGPCEQTWRRARRCSLKVQAVTVGFASRGFW